MKVATILPTKYLPYTLKNNYHMCLAHLIGYGYDRSNNSRHPNLYTRFYSDIGADKSNYLIMDNGVIEGDRRPIEELITKAEIVQADELILPDVLGDMDATLDAGLRALEKLKGTNLKVMAVPQGASLSEWLFCAETMIEWDIHCLGIPKSLVKIAGRDGRLEALVRLGNKTRGLDIHLLGCWQTPLEITLIESAVQNGIIRPVRGVDSAIAYVYSKAGIDIEGDDRPDMKFEFHEDVVIDELLLRRNIRRWELACTGGTDIE